MGKNGICEVTVLLSTDANLYLKFPQVVQEILRSQEWDGQIDVQTEIQRHNAQDFSWSGGIKKRKICTLVSVHHSKYEATFSSQLASLN